MLTYIMFDSSSPTINIEGCSHTLEKNEVEEGEDTLFFYKLFNSENKEVAGMRVRFLNNPIRGGIEGSSIHRNFESYCVLESLHSLNPSSQGRGEYLMEQLFNDCRNQNIYTLHFDLNQGEIKPDYTFFSNLPTKTRMVEILNHSSENTFVYFLNGAPTNLER